MPALQIQSQRRETKQEELHQKECSLQTWCHTCFENDRDNLRQNLEEGGNTKQEISRHLYVGETCRSAFERGFEHVDDIRQLKPTSHMLKHLVDKHETENFDEIDFRMEVISFSRTAYERQIMEAVQMVYLHCLHYLSLIYRHHHIQNSRAEFNRSAIPRLGLKMGGRDIK